MQWATLASLLESAIAGATVEPMVVQSALSAATYFFDSAAQQVMQESRRHVITAMRLPNQQIIDMLPITGTDLFGKQFRAILKDRSKTFKELDQVVRRNTRGALVKRPG